MFAESEGANLEAASFEEDREDPSSEVVALGTPTFEEAAVTEEAVEVPAVEALEALDAS